MPHGRRTRSSPPETLEACLTRLRSLPRRAASSPWPPVSDRGHAAVLAVLFDARDDPTRAPRLLLTRRANLRSHSGEVALPGGRRDPEDEIEAEAGRGGGGGGNGGRGGSEAGAATSSSSQPLSVDAVTALREAHEEIGLHPSQLEVVAELPPLLSKHLLSVAVVVASLRTQPESVEAFLDSLKPSTEEVDAVFEAPLGLFLDPPTFSATAARSAAAVMATTKKKKGKEKETEESEGVEGNGSSASALSCSYSHRDARFGRVPSAPRFRLHFFDMSDRPCVFSGAGDAEKKKKNKDDFLVWGLTAGIAVGVAGAALGRPPRFEVTPPRAADYGRIRCFRDRNGGMPMVVKEEEEEESVNEKKRKR